MNRLLFILALFLTSSAFCQPKTPEEYGLKSFTIEDSEFGPVDFYVTKSGIDTKKPLMLILDGSGSFPMYRMEKNENGGLLIYSSNPFPFSELAAEYHVVLISKPGVPFIDTSLSDTGHNGFNPSELYTRMLSLNWRAGTASTVLNYCLKNLKVDSASVFVLGYSEGGQVAPKVAVLNPHVTKVVSIVGGGLNQFYDFITQERVKALKGEISPVEAQANIDTLMTAFREIYADPNNTERMWYGHSYQRWASFCSDVPLENMLKLDIPILLVSGGMDNNSPIIGLDYVPLEFLRLGKTNLTYKVYPACDHHFNDQVLEDNRMHEMLDYVTGWLKKDD